MNLVSFAFGATPGSNLKGMGGIKGDGIKGEGIKVEGSLIPSVLVNLSSLKRFRTFRCG